MKIKKSKRNKRKLLTPQMLKGCAATPPYKKTNFTVFSYICISARSRDFSSNPLNHIMVYMAKESIALITWYSIFVAYNSRKNARLTSLPWKKRPCMAAKEVKNLLACCWPRRPVSASAKLGAEAGGYIPGSRLFPPKMTFKHPSQPKTLKIISITLTQMKCFAN